MENFNIEEVNVSMVLINNFYRISKDVYNRICTIDNHREKILDSLEIDRSIVESQTGQFEQITKRYMSQILLYELLEGKHISIMTLDEIKSIIISIANDEKFKSLSSYLSFIRSIHLATKWAYTNMWRGDYYNAADIMKEVNTSDIISLDSVFTIPEMRQIANMVDGIDTKITILALTEGIKTSELILLKRSQFSSLENDKLIQLNEGRSLKMSDELYSLCHEFSYMEYFDYKYRDRTDMTRLEDSEYLIRGSVVGRASNIKDRSNKLTNLANRCSRALKDINMSINTSKIRTYSMYYDALKGNNIEYINNKYGTKYAHKRILLKDRELESRMIDKIIYE